MYAELIGNYKKQKIKNFYDNTLMAEVGDEELRDIVPKKVEVVSQKFQDIGYYIDEKGIKRYGKIPKPYDNMVKGNINTGYVEGYNITSNPRYR